MHLFVNSYNTVDGKILLELGDGTLGSQMATPADTFPTDGAWHHVAVTSNRTMGSATLYLDGVQRASRTGLVLDFPVSTTADIIGQFADHNFQLQGGVDDFRIYSGLLSQNDVLRSSRNRAR